MTVLYRGMKEDEEGRPACGPSARTLGVRLDGDIVVRADGSVEPGTGGMSVGLGDPEHVPPHRRPSEFGGWGRDPLWMIDEADLPSMLKLRPDPEAPLRHGFVEPIERMSLAAYQEALAVSRGFWTRA
jgi:hypothetical protein